MGEGGTVAVRSGRSTVLPGASLLLYFTLPRYYLSLSDFVVGRRVGVFLPVVAATRGCVL